ncbi:Phosphoesterase [Candidatus Magnetomoraceae bacterium gMMP-1]
MLLKIDLHIHTREDIDNSISYTARDLIKTARAKGFDAIAITNHNAITYSPELQKFAENQDIVLIPGTEASINNKHILLLNMPYDDNIKTYEDIALRKSPETLVIAPHPYFPGMQSMGRKIEEYPDLFDAVEFCHFYNPCLNFNHEAQRFASKHNLPMVATSDAHIIEQFGNCYSFVDGEKSISGIIRAIKAGRVKIVAPPLSLAKMIRIYIKIMWNKKTLHKMIMRLSGIAVRMARVKMMRERIKK